MELARPVPDLAVVAVLVAWAVVVPLPLVSTDDHWLAVVAVAPT